MVLGTQVVVWVSLSPVYPTGLFAVPSWADTPYSGISARKAALVRSVARARFRGPHAASIPTTSRESFVPSAGDFDWPDGWEAVIPALTHRVKSFCRARGMNGPDTDDAVQLVLLRMTVEAAVRKRDFTSFLELSAWASQFLRSQLGKQNRRKALANVASGVDVAGLPDKSDDTVAREPLAEHLSKIDDPRERRVLSLLYLDGMKLREAATELGVSISLVHKLHGRALDRLRRRLGV